jgi:hypothetical protein
VALIEDLIVKNTMVKSEFNWDDQFKIYDLFNYIYPCMCMMSSFVFHVCAWSKYLVYGVISRQNQLNTPHHAYQLT